MTYYNEVKVELKNYDKDKDWQMILIFTEISQLMLHGYSIIIEKNVKKDIHRQRLRNWNAKYDNNRFSNGIYNIDRLAIKELCQELQNEEMTGFNLENVDKFDLNNLEDIVLDGLDCELSLPLVRKKYNWKIDIEMNEDLSKCVQNLRTHASCQ